MFGLKRPSLIHFARIHRPDERGRVAIDKRNVYILPTRYGLMFAVLIGLVLIGAINYANNPAFLLAFLMCGIGAAAILQTWRNLTGLQLHLLGSDPVFCGETANFRLRLSNDRAQARPALQFDLDDAEPCLLDLPASGRRDCTLALATRRRGRLAVGRLVISTRYPLGLLRAWCYVDSDQQTLVYPRPAGPWQPPALADEQGREQGDRGEGTDDFRGLRDYRPGDPPRHIDWKSLAGERGLLTKQFGGEAASHLWLDWLHTPGRDLEDRLSHLCRAVLDAEQQHQPYGLRLPGSEIPPALGPAQRARCLRALALFGETP